MGMKKLFILAVLILISSTFAGCQSILDRKTKSGLQVITDDVPSSVFINGQYLNNTPLIEKELKPGEYSIKIQPNDSSLVAYETTVTLRKNLLTVVTWKPGSRPELSGGVIYEMEPLTDSSKAEVSFETVPEGAIVSLQGKDKDFTPVVFSDVTPGNQGFEITLPSYETQSHTINVQPGYRMLVRVKLAKLQPVGETATIGETATETPPPASPSATLKVEGTTGNNPASPSGSVLGNNQASTSAVVETEFTKLLE